MQDQHPIARQRMINATNVNDVYANQFDPAFGQMYGLASAINSEGGNN